MLCRASQLKQITIAVTREPLPLGSNFCLIIVKGYFHDSSLFLSTFLSSASLNTLADIRCAGTF